MFQLLYDYHARICWLTCFVSLGFFPGLSLSTTGYLAFLVLPFGDMSLCWFSSRRYVSLPMGYGSSLIFYRLGCCEAIGFGLCLFSFIVIAWCEPCFYFRGCNAKDSIRLGRFGLSVGLHPARFGAPPGEPRLLRAPPCFTVLMTLPSYDNSLSGTGDLFVRCVRTLLSLHVFAPNIWCSQH
jgi:hypothetical protein